MGKKAINVAHLNDAFALDAQCPADQRYIVWQDKDAPCFCLRVMNTGSKAWLMNSRTHGQRTVGKVPDLKASKARVMAEEILEQLKAGREVLKKTRNKPRETLIN